MLSLDAGCCRIHEAAQAAQQGNQQTLKLIAAGFGSVGALVRLLSIPFCSGTEAAVKLLGGLAQNVAGMAVEIANAGAGSSSGHTVLLASLQ